MSSVQVARVPWRLLPTLLLISVVLTGCLTLQPKLPGTNPTVTVSGTVRTAVESHHVAATAADHTVQATSAPIPVQAMRVGADGKLTPVGSPTVTDAQGRFTLANVPNHTHVVLQASVTTQSGDVVTLQSSTVTDGPTEQDIDPLYHVAYEVLHRFARQAMALWNLEIPTPAVHELIELTTGIFFSDVLPHIGPPPEIDVWHIEERCTIAEPESAQPILSKVRCYVDRLERNMSENMMMHLYEIVSPHIPTARIAQVGAGVITVDGSNDDWADIAPITINRGGPMRWDEIMNPVSASALLTDLRQLSMARDDENLYVLIEFDTSSRDVDWPFYTLQLFDRPGFWDTSLHLGLTKDAVHSAVMGLGTHLDTGLVTQAAQGHSIELSFPYQWIEDVFGDLPFLVLLSSEWSERVECEVTCYPAQWRDALPIVRLEQRVD